MFFYFICFKLHFKRLKTTKLKYIITLLCKKKALIGLLNLLEELLQILILSYVDKSYSSTKSEPWLLFHNINLAL